MRTIAHTKPQASRSQAPTALWQYVWRALRRSRDWTLASRSCSPHPPRPPRCCPSHRRCAAATHPGFSAPHKVVQRSSHRTRCCCGHTGVGMPLPAPHVHAQAAAAGTQGTDRATHDQVQPPSQSLAVSYYSTHHSTSHGMMLLSHPAHARKLRFCIYAWFGPPVPCTAGMPSRSAH
jgi:hypothetical protein